MPEIRKVANAKDANLHDAVNEPHSSRGCLLLEQGAPMRKLMRYQFTLAAVADRGYVL
jgi:hypothetical protein